MKPHPTLKKPTIFSGLLPDQVKEFHLAQVIRGLFGKGGVTISLRAHSGTPAPGKARRSFARFDFVDLASAEKALIVLNDLPIPRTTPTVNMTLALRPPDQAAHPPPPVDVYPRTINFLKGTAKTCNNMYDLLRPSGPIYFLKDDAVLGHRVQFYSEEDALRAAESVMTIATLQAYHPRSVYCTNVPLNEQAIRGIFEECGTITEVVLNPYNVLDLGSMGFAFVTFSLAQEADKAIRSVNGIRGGRTKQIVVRCRYVSRPEAQPTKRETTQERDAPDDDALAEESEPESSARGSEPSPTNDTTDAPSNAPAGTNISEQWNQMWKLEAKRLEAELIQLRQGGLFISEVEVRKIRLEKEAEIEEMGREKSALEKLHSEEVAGLRADMDELRDELRQEMEREESALEKLHSAAEEVAALQAGMTGLRDELKASTAKIADLQRDLTLSESRRKILELEIHRPMWEQAKREREAKEAEERRREEIAKAQKKMRAMEEEEKERKRKEKEEQLKREAAEREKKRREEAERKERERLEKERKEKERLEQEREMKRWSEATKREEVRVEKWRDDTFWNASPWTKVWALNRFKMLADQFSSISFSKEKPLTANAIPWPTLNDPFEFELSTLDWSGVESFFFQTRPLMTPQEYKDLVQRAQRMFHPDRWRSRGLLLTVMDEKLRDTLEKCGNTVSQAVTPLWIKCKET